MSKMLNKGATYPLDRVKENFIFQLEKSGVVDSVDGPTGLNFSAYILDKNSKVIDADSMISHESKKPKSACGSVCCNLNSINLNFKTLPVEVDRIAIILSITNNIDMDQNPNYLNEFACNLYGGKELLLSYHLLREISENVINIAEFYKHGERWVFRAIGQGYEGGSSTINKVYGLQTEAA